MKMLRDWCEVGGKDTQRTPASTPAASPPLPRLAVAAKPRSALPRRVKADLILKCFSSFRAGGIAAEGFVSWAQKSALGQKLSGGARSRVWEGGNNGPAHPGLMVTAEDGSEVPNPPPSMVGTGIPLAVVVRGTRLERKINQLVLFC
ncbi:hypothetical protein O3P69_001894 [Scylla paramamosain]|uniref:Uncharacterized protein n=1 Tax=Scylla paramamosain TaxID=85552 RepID=A0AAW0V160_SCYPA